MLEQCGAHPTAPKVIPDGEIIDVQLVENHPK
jgi:hypothetical protein